MHLILLHIVYACIHFLWPHEQAFLIGYIYIKQNVSCLMTHAEDVMLYVQQKSSQALLRMELVDIDTHNGLHIIVCLPSLPSFFMKRFLNSPQ